MPVCILYNFIYLGAYCKDVILEDVILEGSSKRFWCFVLIGNGFFVFARFLQ